MPKKKSVLTNREQKAITAFKKCFVLLGKAVDNISNVNYKIGEAKDWKDLYNNCAEASLSCEQFIFNIEKGAEYREILRRNRQLEMLKKMDDPE